LIYRLGLVSLVARLIEHLRTRVPLDDPRDGSQGGRVAGPGAFDENCGCADVMFAILPIEPESSAARKTSNIATSGRAD
jgi:hypothetical protein